jgi:hypothetical protein
MLDFSVPQQCLTPCQSSDHGSYCQYQVGYVAPLCHLRSIVFRKPKDGICETKFTDDIIVKGVKWWKNMAGIFPVHVSGWHKAVEHDHDYAEKLGHVPR